MRVGTEVFAESAALLAAASIVVGSSDPNATAYLAAAQQLYAFGKQYQGSYANATDPCLMQHQVGSKWRAALSVAACLTKQRDCLVRMSAIRC